MNSSSVLKTETGSRQRTYPQLDHFFLASFPISHFLLCISVRPVSQCMAYWEEVRPMVDTPRAISCANS